MTAAAVRIAGEVGGAGRFVVPSRSYPGIAWLVDLTPAWAYECPCVGFVTRGSCRHADETMTLVASEPRPDLADQLQRSIDAVTEQRKAS